MGAHGRRPDGHRGAARLALVVALVLAAVTLLAGVGFLGGLCVKLGADDARAFFGFLQVGDRVQIV